MVRILGIDLAWGYRNPDGVCCIEIENGNAYVSEIGLIRGSLALKDWVQNYSKSSSVMAMVDAPIICPNPCLLYTSPSPRDRTRSRMPSSA